MWKRVLILLSIGFAALCFFVALGMYLVTRDHVPPTPRVLAKDFPAQKSNLETILSMSEQDDLIRVNRESYATRRDASHGLSQDRWTLYRRLFAQTELTQGLLRDPASGDVFFQRDAVGIFDGNGLLTNGYSTGYLSCGHKPVHSFPPCSSSLPENSHASERFNDDAYAFIKLTPNWYAYSRGSSRL